ncbi:hypothetical protein REPUB_Repub06bG0077400 [Reevesia pubescens]
MMGGGADLKLLGTRQSMFVQRVVWTLKLKGIEYEFIEEDLFNKSSLLLKSNPVQKTVPVLIHCEKSIPESKIILEYIDETWKETPILPQDPLDRAYMRFWAKFIDEKLVETTIKAFFSTGEDQAKATESAVEALTKLEEEIRGKRFFGGEEIGFLDIAAGWMAHWLPVVEEIGGFKVMDSTKFPSINLWIKEFVQVPTIKQNLPSPNDLHNAYDAFRRAMLGKQ